MIVSMRSRRVDYKGRLSTQCKLLTVSNVKYNESNDGPRPSNVSKCVLIYGTSRGKAYDNRLIGCWALPFDI
jgi:hypothetical protein